MKGPSFNPSNVLTTWDGDERDVGFELMHAGTHSLEIQNLG